VGDSRIGRATTDADHPLAKHGCINQRVTPQHVAHARASPGQVGDAVVGNERHLASGERAKAVVHPLKMKALEVGNVARSVEREDLALALIRELVAAGEPLDQQAAGKRAVPLPDNDLVAPISFSGRGRARTHCNSSSDSGLMLHSLRTSASCSERILTGPAMAAPPSRQAYLRAERSAAGGPGRLTMGLQRLP
jgi:hypothetical protein